MKPGHPAFANGARPRGSVPVRFAFVLMVMLMSAAAAAGRTLSLRERIETRDYPSVFQAWSPATNLPNEDPLTTVARHDLLFSGPAAFHLKWQGPYEGLATSFTPESVIRARALRQTLLRKNPHLVLLAEIRFHDAPRGYLPDDHPWWKRGPGGAPEIGWAEGGYNRMDYSRPDFQKQAAAQARAVVRTGAVDGVMLDWWQDDPAHLALIRAVRRAVGSRALILVNANDHPVLESAPYINGIYMECTRSETPADWERIAATLSWAEGHLRRPHIDCVETWYQHSRQDLNLMRAVTTLSLTRSDGYCLFADPDPLPMADHLHDWYPFWQKTLRRPLAPGTHETNGTWRRDYTRGTAVYNPDGNGLQIIRFSQPRRRQSTGVTGTTFRLNAPDGDLFLR